MSSCLHFHLANQHKLLTTAIHRLSKLSLEAIELINNLQAVNWAEDKTLIFHEKSNKGKLTPQKGPLQCCRQILPSTHKPCLPSKSIYLRYLKLGSDLATPVKAEISYYSPIQTDPSIRIVGLEQEEGELFMEDFCKYWRYSEG